MRVFVRRGSLGQWCVYSRDQHLCCYGDKKNAYAHVDRCNGTAYTKGLDRTAWWRKDRS